MNIGLTKIYAADSANFCRRYSFVRRLGLACAFACAGMSAALAGPYDRGGQREHPHQAQAQPQPRQEPGREAREFNARQFENEARAEEQRRQQQQAQQEQNRRNAEAPRRSGRLTPDERRDLRRQINEAGMDLYPNTPRR